VHGLAHNGGAGLRGEALKVLNCSKKEMSQNLGTPFVYTLAATE
jgi:hypothetical protein